MEIETRYSVRTEIPQILYNDINEAKRKAIEIRMSKATVGLIFWNEEYENSFLQYDLITRDKLNELLSELDNAEQTDVIEWKSIV